MAQAARAPSSVALRMRPSPVQSPAARTLVSGRAATSFSYSSVFGFQGAGEDDAVGGEVSAGAADRGEHDAVGHDPLDRGPHVHGDPEAVEPVHVLGLALVADLRRDRLAGFQHGHQPATRGEEFGELEGDQVAADDHHPAAQRHPCPGSPSAPLPAGPAAAASPSETSLPQRSAGRAHAAGRRRGCSAPPPGRRWPPPPRRAAGRRRRRPKPHGPVRPSTAAADLVAQPPQERLVLGVQDRRPQQRAAGLVVAFEQRDVMSALGGHPSGLHARRAAADHHDSLGVRCADARPARAPCRSRGLTAQSTEKRCSMASMQFSHEMHLRTRSGCPRRSLFGSSASASIGRPIAMKSARPSARICSARCGVVDAADGDHRHVDHLLDRGGGADVECVAVVGGVDHAGDEPVDHPAADVEGVDSGGHQLRCHLGGFEHRPTAGDPLVAGDAQRDRQRVADLGADGGQRLEHHADAALHRVAAVFVGAAVALRRQERAEEHVAVRGVQLDAVVAGLGRAPHRRLEQVEHLDQLLVGDLGRRPAGQVGRDDRRANRSHAVHLGSQPVGPGVHDLRLDLGAVLVHHLDQRAVGVDGRVGAQVQSARRLGVVMVDPGGAHGDQADAALGAGGEVVAGALRRQPVRRAVHRLHRRHHQPVAQRHRADPARRQQMWEGCVCVNRANRPAKARSGRSALVTMPGAASTTARMEFSAGIPVTVMPIAANAVDRREVGAGLGQDQVLAVDARVALDLGDVAALDVPVRIGVRRHLPLQVQLDPLDAVDRADVLRRATAQRPGGQLVPAQVDILGAGAEFVGERRPSSSSMSRQSAISRTPSSNTRVPSSRSRGTSGSSTGRPKPQFCPCLGRVVAGHVDRLDAGDILDVGDIGGVHDRQDLRQAGVHAGAVERRIAALAGGLQNSDSVVPLRR